MISIEKKLLSLKAEGRKGLIMYLTAGYPDYNTTLQAVKAVEAAGADLVELGLPFSDPMADGPIIQQAATQALAAGATVGKALELVTMLKQETTIPLAIMTYYNIVLQYGLKKFADSFAKAGISGLIIPDLPMEEAAIIEPACRQAGIDLIRFIAPTTTPDRLTTICSQASGFLYCISSTGVTGVRQIDYDQLAPLMTTVRQETQLPLAIGFGIGSPAAACQAAQHADAVIVGSAVMERLMNDGVEAVREFTSTIRLALDKGCECR
ncbi:tryptophan synthase subunit alpha [Sporomusa malonica]|uniref:Tryptophan synthase alpha chain n=1 Tax=Sporomusa malonica TaxID=112901 RepID=A0A1W2BR15_9FIRM|nr:tryptophan synthase subunit alpha [Sporomusa malonica]SMC75445.1 tryptophan synthase, alpha chain [Sporomusa malonica]